MLEDSCFVDRVICSATVARPYVAAVACVVVNLVIVTRVVGRSRCWGICRRVCRRHCELAGVADVWCIAAIGAMITSITLTGIRWTVWHLLTNAMRRIA